MKKLIPFLLILSLLLAACGGAAQPAPSQPEPAKTESAPASPSPSPAEETPSQEFELPIMGDEPLTPAGELPALSEETVTLDGIASYLRLTLPEGWTWAQAAGTVDGTVYGLWPEEDPAFKLELHYWPDRFAMCGTGVSFTDYPLPDGKTATLATEQIGKDLTWILILPESPDSFTIQFVGPQALYEAHRAELELLLSTLQQGVKAQLDVVQPGTVTG
ncbi:MAG: hypothetical protein IJQ42_08555 [Oscillospiraceae bacterium]|nr:hypothetical protein [Oscillospiraceae bacterium]